MTAIELENSIGVCVLCEFLSETNGAGLILFAPEHQSRRGDLREFRLPFLPDMESRPVQGQDDMLHAFIDPRRHRWSDISWDPKLLQLLAELCGVELTHPLLPLLRGLPDFGEWVPVVPYADGSTSGRPCTHKVRPERSHACREKTSPVVTNEVNRFPYRFQPPDDPLG